MTSEIETADSLALFIAKCGMLIATIHTLKNLTDGVKPRVKVAAMGDQEEVKFTLALVRRLFIESDEAMELCEKVAVELLPTQVTHDEPERPQ